jgi:glycosyltransferase involved in cell wall biosynthesis
MRVTHVITRLIVGGAQENTIASVLGLRQKPDLDLTLISGPTPPSPEGSLEPVVAAIPRLLIIFPELVRPVAPWTDWLALCHLSEFLLAQQPRIIHTHSGKAGIVGRLAAYRAGVPIIIHTIHGPSFGPFQGRKANFVFRMAEWIAGQFTTHFVVVANAMADQYLRAGIGTPDQYTRIFSGFDIEPFARARNDSSLRAQLGISPDDVVVGKIARLFELKGHDDLFSVAKQVTERVPNLKFLLVGGGEWRERFESMARDLGLARHFVFTGLVPPSEVPRYVGIMDMLVHLSRREGLARALPQALAGGKPIIALDCDGASEVCLEGETGFLVQPGDLNTLAERIVTLARNPPLREQLGGHGQHWVRARFPVERMVDDLYDLYQRLAR